MYIRSNSEFVCEMNIAYSYIVDHTKCDCFFAEEVWRTEKFLRYTLKGNSTVDPSVSSYPPEQLITFNDVE